MHAHQITHSLPPRGLPPIYTREVVGFFLQRDLTQKRNSRTEIYKRRLQDPVVNDLGIVLSLYGCFFIQIDQADGRSFDKYSGAYDACTIGFTEHSFVSTLF